MHVNKTTAKQSGLYLLKWYTRKVPCKTNFQIVLNHASPPLENVLKSHSIASLPPSPKRNFPNFLTPKNSAMENLKFPQKSFDHDLCYFPEYPHPAPSPFLHWDHNRKRSVLFLLTFAVFVCQLVCVFKYSLFYVFDLMMTATLRIYTKIQLSCIFGYCFIAVGRERPAPRRKQSSTRGTQSKKIVL